MITDKELDAIRARVAEFDTKNWRRLDSAERDVVLRAFATADIKTQPVTTAS